MPRVLFLMPTHTYRAGAFLAAAEKLQVEVTVASERAQALADFAPGRTLVVDFTRPREAVQTLVAFAREREVAAVVPVDDDTAVIAAQTAAALGLPGNPPEAVRATREKHRLRQRLQQAGQRVPWFRVCTTADEPETVAAEVSYPCVLKPVFLSASRGVIRADDPESFVRAFQRISALLQQPEVAARGGEAARLILVERYVPGREVALEGLLTDGHLRVLAIFDKPDPLEGPYFEETLYVTPTRLPTEAQQALTDGVAEAVQALGLRHGPVHAELRLNDEGAWLIEIAARSIGGLCSRTLRFGEDVSLEELILRHALGQETASLPREQLASGVMMLPIPQAGVLQEVQGVEAARAVPNVEDVRITIPVGQQLVPLPEGDRYLGFIFARAERPEAVEQALRDAFRRLRFVIEPRS